MRLRHDKRAIRPFILLTVGEKKEERIKGEGEGSKEGPRDKI
jgi:hypothetical protein